MFKLYYRGSEVESGRAVRSALQQLWQDTVVPVDVVRIGSIL